MNNAYFPCKLAFNKTPLRSFLLNFDKSGIFLIWNPKLRSCVFLELALLSRKDFITDILAGNVLNKVEFGRDGNMDLRELGKRIPLYITVHYCITKYCRRTDGLFPLFNTGNVSECRDLLYIPTPKAASLASRTVVCYCNSHSF